MNDIVMRTAKGGEILEFIAATRFYRVDVMDFGPVSSAAFLFGDWVNKRTPALVPYK